MTDEPFYSPTNPGAAARQPRPGERLWTMTRKGHTCWAELRPVPGGPSVELQLLIDGDLRDGRVYPSREMAIARAHDHRARLAAKDWVDLPPSTWPRPPQFAW